MRDAHHSAQLEIAAVVRPPECRVGARLLERLDPGDASLQRLILRTHRRGVAVRLGRRWHGAIRELVGALLEDPRRRAGRVVEDRPALRGDRVLPYLCGAKRSGVEPARVPIAAAHHGRTISGHTVEIRRSGPAAPVVLVEPSAGQPLPRPQVAGATADQLESLVDGLGVSEIDLRHLEAPPHEVDVRVEPAGRHQATAEIHALRRPGVPREVGCAPDRGDTAVAREESVGRDPGPDMDPAAVEKGGAQEPNPARPRSGTNFTAPCRVSRPSG